MPTLPALRTSVDRRRDVEQHIGAVELAGDRHAALNARAVIADFEAGLGAVEQGRRDRQIAMRGVEVGDRANVMIDAHDFLNDDNAAARRAGGVGAPGAEFEAVARPSA